MPQFIEGPPIGISQLPGADLAAGLRDGNSVYYDSTAARAAYYEQASGVNNQLPPIEAVPQDEPVDPAIIAAAASGQAPSAETIAKLQQLARVQEPWTIPTPRPPVQLPPAPAFHSPSLEGLSVRVGKGIVATVTFQGGEPEPKHWARLLKFIEIQAEDDEAELCSANPSTPEIPGKQNSRRRHGTIDPLAHSRGQRRVSALGGGVEANDTDGNAVKEE